MRRRALVGRRRAGAALREVMTGPSWRVASAGAGATSVLSARETPRRRRRAVAAAASSEVAQT
eukprot:4186142-Pyramimonas_sp.AAC.1